MFAKQIVSQISSKSNSQLICYSKRVFSSNTQKSENGHRSGKNTVQFMRQSQGLHAFRPDEMPENPTIILFPGQGAQFVGMAKSLVDIPAAKEMFDIASDVLRLN